MLKPVARSATPLAGGVERRHLARAALEVHDVIDHDRGGAQRPEGLELGGHSSWSSLDGGSLEPSP